MKHTITYYSTINLFYLLGNKLRADIKRWGIKTKKGQDKNPAPF